MAWCCFQVGSETFQHVHIHEGNVYDFTEWVDAHPGASRRGGWGLSGEISGAIEDSKQNLDHAFRFQVFHTQDACLAFECYPHIISMP